MEQWLEYWGMAQFVILGALALTWLVTEAKG